jgi:ATP/maltotriose-dependent transcriptional regulator MalT
MARELGDDEILSHALNNVGTAQLKDHVSRKKGIELFQQSLDLALKNRNRGHAGPAYTSLVNAAMKLNDYSFAREKLQEGIQYCEELDLEFCRSYLLFLKARMKMETGDWEDACHIAENLIQNYGHTPVTKVGALVVAGTIRMRRGEAGAIPLLMEAKELAFKIMEVQRIVPALVALLEYEWLTAETVINEKELENGRRMVERLGNNCDINEFAFWLYKARKKSANVKNPYEGYPINDSNIALRAAGLWGQHGRPYEQAITLFECGEEEKRKAIGILQNLGARAVCEKLKLEMRASGIKSIPRGIRKTTQANPAQLTQRELDVLQLLEKGLQNKEIASKLYISAKTVDHHISAILFKLDVNSRSKAVQESIRLGITK